MLNIKKEVFVLRLPIPLPAEHDSFALNRFRLSGKNLQISYYDDKTKEFVREDKVSNLSILLFTGARTKLYVFPTEKTLLYFSELFKRRNLEIITF